MIGAVVVAAVLLFNWIQERRFRKQADAAFQAPVGDALMQPGTMPRDMHKRVEPALREPVFDAGGPDEIAEAGEPRLRIDAAPTPAAVPPAPLAAAPDLRAPSPLSPPPASLRPAAPPVAAPYDELIEYRVRIGSDGVRADVFADAFSHARSLGKAVRWMGLPVGAAEWEEIQPWREVHYQQVVVTMQLADRNGAVQAYQVSAL